ncbi:Zinc metalloproteinase/disintegrin [Plakobranchus ocellatus]|uniref:Zinc metalloproteinase/disintegrin n=1 Tax=Plakobranchus ocellatus TaxID=259542 RepID=A0AAV4CJI2_9GAST|nr:Zinc metalloproteinase/disintegrin [Plakobranchus ocellatus]
MKSVKILVLLLLLVLTQQNVIPRYELEVYFVVDRAVLDRYVAEQTTEDSATRGKKAWASLTDDIYYFITEINGLFASLQPKGLNITILKRRVDILDINLFDDNASSSLALKAFDDWLASQGAYTAFAYDAAILWTGHEFLSAGTVNAVGHAHVGQVCESVNASGIVKYGMTYQVSLNTAHELGHILGAHHDAYNTGYVMGAKASPLDTNRWQFSLCSKEIFDFILSKPRSNCLKKTSLDSTVISAGVTDALANPDTICRRASGNRRSFACKTPSFYGNSGIQGDSVCKRIWCYEVGTKKCFDTFSSDGLICGKNHRCNDGTCQDHPDAESAAVDPECFWGDQAEIHVMARKGKYVGNCLGLIARDGRSVCYRQAVKMQCCKTCGNFHTGIKGCGYGDIFPWCHYYDRAMICHYYKKSCCLFCQGYKRIRSSESSKNVGRVTIDLSSFAIKVTDELKAIPNEPYVQTPPREED